MSLKSDETSPLFNVHSAGDNENDSNETQNNNKPRRVLIATVAASLAGTMLLMALSSASSASIGPHHLKSSQQYGQVNNINGMMSDEEFHLWEKSLYEKNTNGMTKMSLLGSSKHQHEEHEHVHEHHHSKKKKKKHDNHDKEEEEEEDILFYFNSTLAFDMLNVEDDFYYYQQGWEAQITQSVCPIAASAAVLNSYRGNDNFVLPQDPMYTPYLWATQNQLQANECVKSTIFDKDQLNGIFVGLGLNMAKDFLNCQFVELGNLDFYATAYVVDPQKTSVEVVRTAFIDALQNPTSRVIINYDRGGIGQGPMGHGHFSPIGAYNEDEDAFLIMDVAKYKYPPVWVSATRLYSGISTLDLCSTPNYPTTTNPYVFPPTKGLTAENLNCKQSYRGYIIVNEKSTA